MKTISLLQCARIIPSTNALINFKSSLSLMHESLWTVQGQYDVPIPLMVKPSCRKCVQRKEIFHINAETYLYSIFIQC